jgi:peptide chain release factor 1
MIDIETLKKNPRTMYLAQEYERLLVQENEVKTLIQSDPSMELLAQEELLSLESQKNSIEAQIADIEKAEREEEEFPNEIILEARAGAGGDEAALFAEELVLMYERFAESRGWSVKILDEYTREIRGKDVYKLDRGSSGTTGSCYRKKWTYSYVDCFNCNSSDAQKSKH